MSQIDQKMVVVRAEIAGMQKAEPALTFRRCWDILQSRRPELFETVQAGYEDSEPPAWKTEAEASVVRNRMAIVKSEIATLRKSDSELTFREAWDKVRAKRPELFGQKAKIEKPAKVDNRQVFVVYGENGEVDHLELGEQTSARVVIVDATQAFSGEAPTQIVYMPRGQWRITPRVNGVPQEITVTVDQNTAAILQRSFEKRLSQPVRPIGGFDHKPGSAAFIPKGFTWDPTKGVLLNVDWTKAGREAIEGRNYAYFSPTFLLGGNRVAGLTERGEVGSLTNSPAFEDIERIAASAYVQCSSSSADEALIVCRGVFAIRLW